MIEEFIVKPLCLIGGVISFLVTCALAIVSTALSVIAFALIVIVCGVVLVFLVPTVLFGLGCFFCFDKISEISLSTQIKKYNLNL